MSDMFAVMCVVRYNITCWYLGADIVWLPHLIPSLVRTLAACSTTNTTVLLAHQVPIAVYPLVLPIPLCSNLVPLYIRLVLWKLIGYFLRLWVKYLQSLKYVLNCAYCCSTVLTVILTAVLPTIIQVAVEEHHAIYRIPHKIGLFKAMKRL